MKGVQFEKGVNKWRAYAFDNGKRKHIGRFKTKGEAESARTEYDKKKKGIYHAERPKVESIPQVPHKVFRNGKWVLIKPEPMDVKTFRAKLFGRSLPVLKVGKKAA